MEGLRIIQGVNLLDMVATIEKRKKAHQRGILTELELLIQDKETYKKVRKLILDHTNDYSRSVLVEIFGDNFEGEIS